MKDKIIRALKKHITKLGFQVERIPDTTYFLPKLALQWDSEVWYDFRRFSRTIADTKNHALYDDLLTLLAPDFQNLKITERQFVGYGNGNDTLNAYRQIRKGNDVLFEKVYRTNSVTLIRLLWFYENIYPLIDNEKIKVPALRHILKGKIITIIYFDFVELERLPKPEIFAKSIPVLKSLIMIDFSKLIDRAPESALNQISREFHHIYIVPARQYASEIIGSAELFDKIDGFLMSSKLVFSHADINSKNIFKDNYLIDWDTSGFYPIGCDIGKVISWFYMSENTTANDIVNLLKVNFEDEMPSDEFQRFMLGALFFCFVFSASDIMVGKKVSTATLKSLYERLEEEFASIGFHKV